MPADSGDRIAGPADGAMNESRRTTVTPQIPVDAGRRDERVQVDGGDIRIILRFGLALLVRRMLSDLLAGSPFSTLFLLLLAQRFDAHEHAHSSQSACDPGVQAWAN